MTKKSAWLDYLKKREHPYPWEKTERQEILNGWVKSLFPKVTWEEYKKNEYACVDPEEVERIVDLTIQKLTDKRKLKSKIIKYLVKNKEKGIHFSDLLDSFDNEDR